MDELFLFLDLETTGLDPKRCKIGFGIARAVRRVMWEAPAACTCPDTRIFL